MSEERDFLWHLALVVAFFWRLISVAPRDTFLRRRISMTDDSGDLSRGVFAARSVMRS